MKNLSSNVIYGIHAVEGLISNRMNEIERIFFDSSRTKGNIFNLLKQCKKNKIVYQCIPSKRLNQIAGSVKHQGVAALCTAKPYEDINNVLDRLKAATTPPVLLVPASIEDPRNFGALIRTSVAFGVNAILLERKGTTPLNATVAKASAGMLEYIPVVRPPNLEKVIKELTKNGFSVIGAVSGADKKPHQINLTGPIIIITGGEHRGIPPYLKKLCTDFTGIPTTKEVNSLNISVAASIVMYECIKQRGFLFNR